MTPSIASLLADHVVLFSALATFFLVGGCIAMLTLGELFFTGLGMLIRSLIGPRFHLRLSAET